MATGRPYRIKVESGIKVIKADDHVESKVDIPPVASQQRMGQLIREELLPRGFKDNGGGIISRERNGVRVTMNTEDGIIRAEAGGEIVVPKDAPGGGCTCRISAALREAESKARDMQDEVTGRLIKAIPAIGCEVESAVHRATKRALLEAAAQLGQVKSVSEERDGSMTVVVEA